MAREFCVHGSRIQVQETKLCLGFRPSMHTLPPKTLEVTPPKYINSTRLPPCVVLKEKEKQNKFNICYKRDEKYHLFKLLMYKYYI